MSILYDFKTVLKRGEIDNHFIILKKVSRENGKTKLFKFPADSIDTIIALLQDTKSIISEIETNEETYLIESSIIDTMVSLFLSGISIEDLSTQYNYSEKLIKYNLEKKGLILFD
jgi:hypothetical protein